MNFTKTILNGLKVWVEGRLSNYVPAVKGKGLSTEDYTTEEKEKLANLDSHINIPQSDWNQNNQGAVDYIKNRPFYVGKSDEREIFHTEIESFTIGDNGSCPYGYASIKLEDNIKLLHGEAYIVYWDWTEYKVIAEEFDENSYYIGDILFQQSGETSGDVPFLINFNNNMCYIYALDVTEETEIRNISVYGSTQEIVQIPKQFIPELDGFLKENNPVGYGSFQMNPDYSYRIGENAAAFGDSRAHGKNSFASGDSGAYGDYSHAEGRLNVADGTSSHAEGWSTRARGTGSHSEGSNTIAASDYQHVQGRNNLEDATGKYAHIVGNGSGYRGDKNRYLNIHTLDWEGNAWFSGDIYTGGTGIDYIGAKKIATEDYARAPRYEIPLIDQVNGYTYIVCIKDGNLVTFCSIKEIEIIKMPSKTEYMVGDYFDPEGMVALVTTFDGITKEISNFTYDKSPLTQDVSSVEVYYTENGVTCSATVDIVVVPFNVEVALIDFEYVDNNNSTYTITAWKGTYKGEPSTEIIIPNNNLVIL